MSGRPRPLNTLELISVRLGVARACPRKIRTLGLEAVCGGPREKLAGKEKQKERGDAVCGKR